MLSDNVSASPPYCSWDNVSFSMLHVIFFFTLYDGYKIKSNSRFCFIMISLHYLVAIHFFPIHHLLIILCANHCLCFHGDWKESKIKWGWLGHWKPNRVPAHSCVHPHWGNRGPGWRGFCMLWNMHELRHKSACICLCWLWLSRDSSMQIITPETVDAPCQKLKDFVNSFREKPRKLGYEFCWRP